MSLSHDKTVSSTFQAPVWSLGTQLDIRGSWEFLKSKCPLIFDAFNADDKLLIGNGREMLMNKNKDLMLNDGDVTTYEWRHRLSVSI